MPDDLKIDELSEQLRSYGDWLEQRSDVALSNGERSTAGDAADHAADFERPRPSGGGRLLIVAGAVVLIAGAAILAVANRGEPNGSVSAADGDELTTEAATTEADVESGPDVNGPRSVLDVPPGQDGADAVSAADEAADGNGIAGVGVGVGDDTNSAGEDAEGTQGADAAEGTGDDANGDAGQSGDSDGADQTSSVPSSTTSITSITSTTSNGGSTIGQAPSDNVETETETTKIPSNPAGGSLTFLSPLHGDGVDINLGTTVRVAPIEGATSYTFIAAQNGVEAFRLNVDRPTFIIPGALTAFTDGWKLEAGLMSITAIATDSSGNQLASQTIDVVLKAGGGTPRRDLPGQIMPTIPTIPES